MVTMRKPPTIELVYDRDCPNVERARAMIRAALIEIGTDPTWTEWDREADNTPVNRRVFASPTVLVNGQDVGCDENETLMSDANGCRVYLDETGCLCGAPSSVLIVQAINAEMRDE